MKRIVIVSDLHCGSPVAISSNPKNSTQKTLKAAWEDSIAHFGVSPDILIVNGDAHDGEDKLGRDTDEVDVTEQVEDAYNLIQMWEAPRIMMVSGSGYHTGKTIMHEKYLEKMLRCSGVRTSFHTKLNTKVNKWFNLQCRHHIGTSSIAHGRHTSSAKERSWNVLNAAYESARTGKPAAWPHLCVFSHVHYWNWNEDAWGASCTTPAWQALGGRCGDEKCSGHCDIGSIQLQIEDTKAGGWSWEKRLYPAKVVDRQVHV